MAHTLNFKVSNWGTDIASIPHVRFEHSKSTANILADHVSKLKPMGLYCSLNPKEHGKETWS